jgi:hypothetical protein
MTGLPRSIIKKYGVSKKAWAVFRGRKVRSKTRSTTKQTKVKSRMARRRKTVKHHARRGGMGILGSFIEPLAAMGYGAIRQPVADKIPQIAALGNYSDEVILGGGALALQLLVKKPIVKTITRPIVNVEFARAGEKLRGSMIGGVGSSGMVYY